MDHMWRLFESSVQVIMDGMQLNFTNTATTKGQLFCYLGPLRKLSVGLSRLRTGIHQKRIRVILQVSYSHSPRQPSILLRIKSSRYTVSQTLVHGLEVAMLNWEYVEDWWIEIMHVGVEWMIQAFKFQETIKVDHTSQEKRIISHANISRSSRSEQIELKSLNIINKISYLYKSIYLC